jgi:hypothetical protein
VSVGVNRALSSTAPCLFGFHTHVADVTAVFLWHPEITFPDAKKATFPAAEVAAVSVVGNLYVEFEALSVTELP